MVVTKDKINKNRGSKTIGDVKERSFITIETNKEKINITVVNDRKDLWKNDLNRVLKDIENPIESIMIRFQQEMPNGLIIENKMVIEKRKVGR